MTLAAPQIFEMQCYYCNILSSLELQFDFSFDLSFLERVLTFSGSWSLFVYTSVNNFYLYCMLIREYWWQIFYLFLEFIEILFVASYIVNFCK